MDLYDTPQEGFVCVFTFGENDCVAGALPDEQHFTEVLHFIFQIPLSSEKEPPS